MKLKNTTHGVLSTLAAGTLTAASITITPPLADAQETTPATEMREYSETVDTLTGHGEQMFPGEGRRHGYQIFSSLPGFYACKDDTRGVGEVYQDPRIATHEEDGYVSVEDNHDDLFHGGDRENPSLQVHMTVRKIKNGQVIGEWHDITGELDSNELAFYGLSYGDLLKEINHEAGKINRNPDRSLWFSDSTLKKINDAGFEVKPLSYEWSSSYYYDAVSSYPYHRHYTCKTPTPTITVTRNVTTTETPPAVTTTLPPSTVVTSVTPDPVTVTETPKTETTTATSEVTTTVTSTPPTKTTTLPPVTETVVTTKTPEPQTSTITSTEKVPTTVTHTPEKETVTTSVTPPTVTAPPVTKTEITTSTEKVPTTVTQTPERETVTTSVTPTTVTKNLPTTVVTQETITETKEIPTTVVSTEPGTATTEATTVTETEDCDCTPTTVTETPAPVTSTVVAETPTVTQPAPSTAVENGTAVVHLPEETVTVTPEPEAPKQTPVQRVLASTGASVLGLLGIGAGIAAVGAFMIRRKN